MPVVFLAAFVLTGLRCQRFRGRLRARSPLPRDSCSVCFMMLSVSLFFCVCSVPFLKTFRMFCSAVLWTAIIVD